jgi:sarcosine oxidase, subunit beta
MAIADTPNPTDNTGTTRTSVDVVVIGGGVMGASAAFHLAEAGVSVVLVERDQLASGSTSKAAGGIRAQFSDELNIKIALRSLAAFEAFGTRPGADIGLHQNGYLFLLTTEAEVETVTKDVALQQSLGVPSVMLTPVEAAALSPFIDISDVLAASFCPIDGHCTPESVVLGYATGAREYGARVLTNTAVTGIELSGNQIKGVHTTSGYIATSTVICAAGAWSPAVGAMVGIDIPVSPVRRPIWYTEPMANVPKNCPMTIDFSSGFYFHPEGPGLLFGMADRDQPAGFEHEIKPGWLETVSEVISHRAPALLDVGVAGGWTGFYEVTPDHNALIGESTKVSRFLYATGFSGHGFLQGPAVGELLRDFVLHRDPFVDVSGLAIERFEHGGSRPEHRIV